MQQIKALDCPECGHANPDVRELGHPLPNGCGRCGRIWRLQDVDVPPLALDVKGAQAILDRLKTG